MQLKTFFYNRKNGWADLLPADWDSPQTLVMTFGATSFFDAPEPIHELVGKFPQSKIIGCSTAGEILGLTVTDDSLIGAVLQFDKTSLQTASAPICSEKESFGAGKKIALELNRNDLRGVVVLSNGLNVNGSQLVAGINSVLPPSVTVTGGLAGDGDRFTRTWILRDNALERDFVSAVGFYGEHINISHGSKGGWDIFGPERKVTKAKNNHLFELDGKPALQLYKNYLGDRAAELPASALLFPLALRSEKSDEKQIVRTILSVNEDEQSMIFAGDVPEGALVQLMRANFDRLIDGASGAAMMTRQNAAPNGDILSLAISCVGRRLILGERTEEELEAVMDCLPDGAKQIGFYSYGEISPYTNGHCDLHNQTMTLTTISED